MIRVYISGPMTGKALFNFPAFQNAKEYLKRQGYEPVNPAEITSLFGGPAEVDASYAARRRLMQRQCEYASIEDRDSDEKAAKLFDALMDADLAAVRSCQAIYMLLGWENSEGAKKELCEAIKNKLDVILQKKGDCHDA